MREQIRFEQLNSGWNADPNAPELQVTVCGTDVRISFYLNAFQFEQFTEGEKARITFYRCRQYRNGPPNEEGFYVHGQSRFQKYGVKWGEFYLVHNSDWEHDFPDPVPVGETSGPMKHYLFYLKDETFECIAEGYRIEFTKDG